MRIADSPVLTIHWHYHPVRAAARTTQRPRNLSYLADKRTFIKSRRACQRTNSVFSATFRSSRPADAPLKTKIIFQKRKNHRQILQLPQPVTSEGTARDSHWELRAKLLWDCLLFEAPRGKKAEIRPQGLTSIVFSPIVKFSLHPIDRQL